MLGALYLALLIAGLIGFVLHLVAQYRVARILRKRYPQQWDIVSADRDERPRKLKTWSRLQRVLRSNVPELFDDAELTRWHRWWRFGPWVAWPCWLGAVALHVFVVGP